VGFAIGIGARQHALQQRGQHHKVLACPHDMLCELKEQVDTCRPRVYRREPGAGCRSGFKEGHCGVEDG
jgi:hypothetical protein